MLAAIARYLERSQLLGMMLLHLHVNLNAAAAADDDNDNDDDNDDEHILWVLERTVSLRLFFCKPTTYVLLEKKETLLSITHSSGDLVMETSIQVYTVQIG